MRENDALKPLKEIISGMDEISHILDQMLVLAELSASDLDLNRDAMQKTLDRLTARIDRVADRIDWIADHPGTDQISDTHPKYG